MGQTAVFTANLLCFGKDQDGVHAASDVFMLIQGVSIWLDHVLSDAGMRIPSRESVLMF
jgi:hypothetical protein